MSRRTSATARDAALGRRVADRGGVAVSRRGVAALRADRDPG
jgi:hypothetical protein